MKTIQDRLAEGDKSYFDVSPVEQKAYLKKLGNAKNDLDRSYKQYKSQFYYKSTIKAILLHLTSIPLLIGLLPYYIIRGWFLKRGNTLEAISRIKETEHCEPDSLVNSLSIDRTHWGEKGAICADDLLFTLGFSIRYIIHPYFVVKSLYKIAKYSGLIYRYRPSTIIVCDEFSFTSSLLTSLCERHGVTHIDVMHGEKLFDITDAYFRFHRCYVWDEHYRDLFIELNAEPNQFIIELPLSMRFDKKKYLCSDTYADYKYYLDSYDENEIKSIVESMKFIKTEGKTIKYRPHPHYSDLELLRKYVNEEEIEIPANVDILVSISNCQFVVGLHTTVLVQAFFNKQEVILDDVTYKDKYDKLADLRYILANKVANRLSFYQ